MHILIIQFCNIVHSMLCALVRRTVDAKLWTCFIQF